jgi:hypothetical protein
MAVSMAGERILRLSNWSICMKLKIDASFLGQASHPYFLFDIKLYNTDEGAIR